MISGKSEKHQPWDLAGKILRQICRKKNSELSRLDFNDTVIGQEFLQVVAHISHLLRFFVWICLVLDPWKKAILSGGLPYYLKCLLPNGSYQGFSYIPNTRSATPPRLNHQGFGQCCEPDLNTITSLFQTRIVPWVPSTSMEKWRNWLDLNGLERYLQPVVDQTEVWKNTDSF